MCVKTSSARRSNVSALGSFVLGVLRCSQQCFVPVAA